MSLATISIVGNLAREPEQFQFASGRIKTTLFVAVNSFNKIKKEKTTDYYRVETWDRLAELSRDYLHKGNQVAVSGKIALDKWVDREGKDRVTPTVQANQLAFPPRLRPTYSEQSETHVEYAHVANVESKSNSVPPEAEMPEVNMQPDIIPPEVDMPPEAGMPPDMDLIPEEEETAPLPVVEKSSRKKTA